MSMPVLAACRAALLATVAMPGHSQAAAPAAPVADAASQEDPAMQAGRELSQLFLQGDTDAVWARMSPQMQEALGSAAALAQFRAQVAGSLGEEEAILDESTETAPGADVYLRTSRWSRLPTPILMQWEVDDAGKEAGFILRPKPGGQPQAAPSPSLVYPTQNRPRHPPKRARDT